MHHPSRVDVGGLRNGGQDRFRPLRINSLRDRRTSDPALPLGDQMGQNVKRNLVGEPQGLVPATECEFSRRLIR